MCFILLLVILNQSGLLIHTNNDTSWQICTEPAVKDVLFTSNLPPHSPIRIYSDLDFESQGWPGNGTIDQPYVISGYSIVHSDTCIIITGVTVRYVIRNCELINTNLQVPSAGIVSDSPGIVEDCNITAPFGIYFTGPNNTIRNCRMTDCWTGIRIDNAHNSNVNGNVINSVEQGIFNVQSTGCLFDQNTVDDCSMGIRVSGPNCIVMRNVITNAIWGMQIDEPNILVQNNTLVENQLSGYSALIVFGPYCEIVENRIFGDLRIQSIECTLRNNELDDYLIFTDSSYESWNHTLVGNTVNGEPILYAKNQVGESIDASDYGQVILLDCSNCIVSGAISDAPIMVGYSTSITIKNNIITDLDFGPTFTAVVNSTICNNTLRGNEWGLNIMNSFNCTIEENMISNGAFGIHLSDCNNLTFRFNDIRNCDTGIELSNAYYCQLYNNTFVDNIWWGINAAPPTPSISYVLADEVPQKTTRIAWNDFIDNPKNAEDNSQKIAEYEYNYWSDYTGIDDNDDGFGDTPYSIIGSADAEDPIPRMTPGVRPQVTPTTPTPSITTTEPTTNNTGQSTPDYLPFLASVGILSNIVIITALVVIMRKRN